MKRAYSILLVLLAAYSCETDITEQFRDINSQKYVLSGDIEAYKHPKVNLSRTITLTDVDRVVFIDTALVEVTADNVVYTLLPLGDGNYCTEDFIVQPGQTLHFRCSGTDLPDATCTIEVPVVPYIDTVTYSVDDDNRLHINTVFSDPALETDFYTYFVYGWNKEVQISQDSTGAEIRDTVYFLGHYFMSMGGNIAEYANNYNSVWVQEDSVVYASTFYFSDKRFNGTTFTLKSLLYLRDIYIDSIPVITVHLQKRDGFFFQFLNSYVKSLPDPDLEIDTDFPLTQPVHVFSNIEGGFGLISAKTDFAFSIDLSEMFNDPAFLQYMEEQ